jgi:hypothetical protein
MTFPCSQPDVGFFIRRGTIRILRHGSALAQSNQRMVVASALPTTTSGSALDHAPAPGVNV